MARHENTVLIVKDGACYDYIIVGAGSAGSVIASRLSENPYVSVLLIEAGGDPPIEANLPGLSTYALRSHSDWNHTSQVDPEAFKCMKNNKFPVDHGKALGGTSNINGMMYVRGNPRDYNTWAALTGDQSWNYRNVLPYFRKSERLKSYSVLNSPNAYFHGTKGNLNVTKNYHNSINKYQNSFRELGYNIVLDTNGYNTLGFSEPLVTVADGIRQSTANAFLSKVKGRPNLHVMKNSLATKIVIDKFKVARGVKVKDENNNYITVYAKKEIIISAGAINSPQLLMLSGIGPRSKLQRFNINVQADLPVGERLLDHKAPIIVIKLGKSNEKHEPFNPHEFPTPLMVGFVALNASQTFPDYQVVTNFVDDKGTVGLLAEEALNDETCQYFYDKTKGHDVLVLVLTNFDQKTRGHVSIKSSNPEDSPDIYIKPFPDNVDLDKYVKYINDILRVVNTTYFKKIGAEIIKLPQCDSFSVSSKDYWGCHMQCLTSTFYHFSGTCAMGTVVDSRLRVYGIRGLRVADAGVMPTITSGNINVPTIMIGEKAADMIKEDNRARA